MKDNARIEVHFETKDGKKLKVLIVPNQGIQGILLNPLNPPRDRVPVKLAQAQPELASVELGDGPGVCYMIDGTLHCW